LCLLTAISFGVDPRTGKYIEASRPGSKVTPLEVGFFVFLLDVDDINDAAQNFTTNVFMTMVWKDERLAIAGDSVRNIPLEKVWNPQVIIANQQGLVRTSLPKMVRVESDGTVMYRQRYVGPLSQPLKLKEFPFDKHDFGIHFISTMYTPEEVKFVATPSIRDSSVVGGAMYKEFSVADWEIVDFEVKMQPYIPVPGIEAAGFIFEFTAERYVLYYVWQVIVPLFLIVLMSWGALWIDPTNSGTQIGLATSSILTLIAYRFMLGNLIPRLPYMTRLDYFTLGSTVLVFFMLIEVVTTSFLARHGMEKSARRMDIVGRVVFPIVFIGWSMWSLAS
jgi:hypothetical protein